MDVKTKLMNRIGFLKWVQLDPADIPLFGGVGPDYEGKVFISPDVNSVHLVWTLPDECLFQHEIADYPNDWLSDTRTVLDFLEDELFQDAWETENLENEGDIYDLLSDYAEMDRINMPVLTLAELDSDSMRKNMRGKLVNRN